MTYSINGSMPSASMAFMKKIRSQDRGSAADPAGGPQTRGLESIFAMFDADSSGTVTADEMETGFAGLLSGGPSRGRPPGGGPGGAGAAGGAGASALLAELMQKMSEEEENGKDALDTNGDGVVDASELAAASNSFLESYAKSAHGSADSGSRYGASSARSIAQGRLTNLFG